MINFILGMIVGGTLGTMLLCVLIVGKRADKKMEEWK